MKNQPPKFHGASPEHGLSTADTIAAIATAAGAAGIAIVRVSGPASIDIARKIFQWRAGPPPDFRQARMLRHGFVRADQSILDEVLLLVMRAPHSYTGEHVVEFQGHGGDVPARRILRLVLQQGARMAEPGEFTRRAFLNGRLDLVQAEAVLDLIRAGSDRAADAALEQLTGKLSAPLHKLHGQLMNVAADIEASLDFSEDETPTELLSDIRRELTSAANLLTELLDTWNEGHLLREGALVVIAGRPNAGKSTLLNALLGHARAIVADTPGTTRDSIEETWRLDDYQIRLVDTAGLRSGACRVEQEGVRRARDLMRRADLHLYVVDVSMPQSADDRDNLAALPPERCVVILNKSDLPACVKPDDFRGYTAIPAALTQGRGLPELKDAMREKLSISPGGPALPHAVISERHRVLLEQARADLHQALVISAEGREDLLAPMAAVIRDAVEQIGLMLGKTYHADLLDAVFSRFCVGK